MKPKVLPSIPLVKWIFFFLLLLFFFKYREKKTKKQEKDGWKVFYKMETF